MIESKKQRQVAAILEKALNDIFVKLGLNIMHGGMVSISNITITPDLLEARIYLSFYNVEDKASALHTIQLKSWEVKRLLTVEVRKQLRRIPIILFHIDNTLEEAFKMNQLLEEIKKNNR
ncbi:MAG: ribosome-binding factor A [Phycisphaerales bacterium]|nr:ribosome-binding factor A [Phycisphaerales bacterium]